MTPEEASLEGQANQGTENNLSSVKITRNSKGYNWELKVKHEDPYKALEISVDIEQKIAARYK